MVCSHQIHPEQVFQRSLLVDVHRGRLEKARHACIHKHYLTQANIKWVVMLMRNRNMTHA